MIVKAKGKFLRISPVKVRRVISLIKGKDVTNALAVISSLNKRPKEFIEKILKSAISNAKQKGVTQERLYISKITADSGPMWKRYRAAAFGRATPILKRTTHINIELDLKQDKQ